MKICGGKTFWVVSCPENTLFRGSEKEYFYNYEEALTAAKHLAQEFPGNMFLVMQAVSVSYVKQPEPTTYVFSDEKEDNLREEFSTLMQGREQQQREMKKSRSVQAKSLKNFVRVV